MAWFFRPSRQPTGEDPLLALARRGASGDAAAREELLRAVYDDVRRLMHKLVGDDRDYEDLVQNALVRLLEGLPRFRGTSPLRVYLASVCVHLAKDHYRRRRARPEAPVDETLESGQRPVDQVVGARRELKALEKALGQLSDEQRIAVLLRTVEGLSVGEVAVAMGAAVSTTRLRLYYGRKRLAAALGRTAVTEETDG